MSIEIVRVVFALFSDNARAFLLMCQRAWDSPAVGHLSLQAGLAWAMLVGRSARARVASLVGRVGPKLV